MFDFSKIDGRKFYIGIAAILVVAIGENLAPGAVQQFFSEVNLLDFSEIEGQGWLAWMLWAFRSAMKKLEA